MTVTKFNVAEAVFRNVLRKQPSHAAAFKLSRRIGNADLERLCDKGAAEGAISKLSAGMVREVCDALRDRLVNAGPHVIDLQLNVAYDPEDESHRIIASTPCIPAKTYGAEVSREQLVVAANDGPVVALPERPRSPWERLKGFVAELAQGVKYDGPRGRIDA